MLPVAIMAFPAVAPALAAELVALCPAPCHRGNGGTGCPGDSMAFRHSIDVVPGTFYFIAVSPYNIFTRPTFQLELSLQQRVPALPPPR